jgi:hypothetical protein
MSIGKDVDTQNEMCRYMYKYHLRFIPDGPTDISQICLRDTHIYVARWSRGQCASACDRGSEATLVIRKARQAVGPGCIYCSR